MNHPLWLNECTILRCSVYLELFFGITGLMVAWHSGSQAVFLDGGYSLICTLTMMANVRIARLVTKHPTPEKPFGRAPLEPLMLLLESSLLLLMCISLLTMAIYEISTGGYLPEFSLALAYEVFSMIVGGSVAVLFLFVHRTTHSPLIYFEFQEWLLDAVLSTSATVAFTIAHWLGTTHPITPYIDSILTLLLVGLLIRLPIKTFSKNFRQLLFTAKPEAQLIEHINNSLWNLENPLTKEMMNIHIIRIGRWHLANITINIQSDTPCPTYHELGKIKSAVENSMLEKHQYIKVNLQLSLSDYGAVPK
ncbi:cation transporter [uncultured Endozoicomonas sp.]|uniref:cation transporter n=1 Tax=uncultured Endozoicomonas sp. TaxID=432652 RepID=UPI0026075016|nr:cation transporter [uncultured Endozoicomonas sp.]